VKEPIRRDNVTFFFNGATLNFPDTTPSEIPAGYVIHLPVPWQTIHPDKNKLRIAVERGAVLVLDKLQLNSGPIDAVDTLVQKGE